MDTAARSRSGPRSRPPPAEDRPLSDRGPEDARSRPAPGPARPRAENRPGPEGGATPSDRPEDVPDGEGDAAATLGVTTRDFAIFQVKLLLDGMKDFVLLNLSVVAYLLDLFSGRGRRRRIFYRVMELGERLDLWLNLHGAAGEAESSGDGLFGASRAGSPTLLGSVEQWVRGGDEPRSIRESLGRWVDAHGERREPPPSAGDRGRAA